MARKGLKLSLGESATTSDVADDPGLEVNLDHLRLLVKDSLDKNLFDTAIFFANKLVTLSGANPSDVHLLAQAYFLGKQFRRAVHLIQTNGFLVQSPQDSNIDFVLLASQCLVESGQHEEAHGLLEGFLGEPDTTSLRKRARRLANHVGCINSLSALCLLQGKVAETLDNRSKAVQWYKAALFCDIFCSEAFDLLVDNQLKPNEEKDLIRELVECGAFGREATWLRVIYESRLSKHDYAVPVDEKFSPLETVKCATNITLVNDLDCAADRASALFTQHDPQGAFQVAKRIREQDPYHLRSITVYLASLVELGKKSELFHTSHALVDAYPTQAVSWFAVGCYYYAIEKYDAARRFFHKATTMNQSFTAAWLGFGHAFAAQDESDQAMTAYRTASRLFTGSHLPILCTAIEYLRTNNVMLAEQFCRQAQSMCSTDPLVLNELGVVYFRQQKYEKSCECFLKSLDLCKFQPERLRHAWEPSIFNLGHAYRKLREFGQAVHYYELALSYSPKEASTYSALGFTYHLQGKSELAIQNYHNALGLKPEDTFASEMLQRALSEAYAEGGFDSFLDPDDEPPSPPGTKYTKSSKPGFDVHVSMEF